MDGKSDEHVINNFEMKLIEEDLEFVDETDAHVTEKASFHFINDKFEVRIKEQYKRAVNEDEDENTCNEEDIDADGDTFHEEFLMNAISAVQEDSEEEDGIDDIDVDFDEGDCNAYIHENCHSSIFEDDQEIIMVKQEEVVCIPETTRDENEKECIDYDKEQENGSWMYVQNNGNYEANTNFEVDGRSNGSVETLTQLSDTTSNPSENCLIPTFNGDLPPECDMRPTFIKDSSITSSQINNTELPSCNDVSPPPKHSPKCKCQICESLMDTYNEFVDKYKRNTDLRNTSKAEKIGKEMNDFRNTIINQYKEQYLIHKCDKCGQRFAFYSALKKHYMEIHPDVLPPPEDIKINKALTKISKNHNPVKSASNFFRKQLKLCREQEEGVQKTGKEKREELAIQEKIRKEEKWIKVREEWALANEEIRIQEERNKAKEQVKKQAKQTYFYPMVYPVYFVVDNPSVPPGIIPDILPKPPAMFDMSTKPHILPKATVFDSLPKQGMKEKGEDTKPFVCGNCGSTFTTRNQLAAHMRVHSTQPHNCDTCSLTFENHVELKRHYRSHTINVSFKCHQCSDSFTSSTDLKEHVKVHLEFLEKGSMEEAAEASYECEICSVCYTARVDLDMHILKQHFSKHHIEDDSSKCFFCGAVFANNEILRVHLKSHNKNQQQQQQMESQEQSGSVHTKHSTYKPFLCDTCGASFRCTFSLNRHKRTHTGERPYRCDECGARFSTNGQKKSHVLTHTGERPYKCDLCDASFIQQGNLKRHKWTHTGERPYTCTVCGSGFLSTSDLKRHIRIHTGERPYRCHLCPGSYTTSGNLKSHLKTHVSIDQFYIP